MYKVWMAEPVTGTKDQLQIVGMIEVPHMPAAGDKFMNQNIVNGKVIRMNCEVAKVIPSSDLATAIPTTVKPPDAIMVVRILDTQGVKPAQS